MRIARISAASAVTLLFAVGLFLLLVAVDGAAGGTAGGTATAADRCTGYHACQPSPKPSVSKTPSPKPTVSPTRSPSRPPTPTATMTLSASPTPQLPRTGAATGWYLGAGAFLLVGGGVLAAVTRRRRTR